MTGWVGAVSCFVHLRWGRVKEKQEVIQHKVSILPLASVRGEMRAGLLLATLCKACQRTGRRPLANVMYTEKILDNKSSSRHCMKFIVKKTNLLRYAQTNLKSNQTTNDIVARDCHDYILRMSSTDSYRSGFHGGRTCRKSNPVQVTSS